MGSRLETRFERFAETMIQALGHAIINNTVQLDVDFFVMYEHFSCARGPQAFK